MPYKRIKDLSKTIAIWKLKSFVKPYYFHVYLWEDQKAFDENTLDNKPGYSAGCANLAPDIIEITSKGERRIIRPKLGEVHFIKDKWTLEIVTHELMHAVIHRIRMLDNPTFKQLYDQEPHSVEEDVCYEFGRWCDETYKQLWEVNPSKKWKRR